MVIPEKDFWMENYTVAHLAAKGRFYNFLHNICIDKYGFDVDFYRPRAKLTLLHVVAKYNSWYQWSEDERIQLKKLVDGSTNLTLTNNLGFTVLETIKNQSSSSSSKKNIGDMKIWIQEQIKLRTIKTIFLFEQKRIRKNGNTLPNRYIIRDIMKYID